MAIRTTVRLADPIGNHRIEIADYSRLDYVLNCSPGAVGILEMTLPTSFDTSLLQVDGRLGVWRSIDGRPAYLDGNAIFLIQTLAYRASSTFVRAYHATQLMERRIIAYYAGSSYSSKTKNTDDMIKEYWRENAGSSIAASTRDGDETGADLSSYVSVQANTADGPLLDFAACRRNLLDTCREIAEASAEDGTYLTFEIMAPTESTLELRTYTGQRGVDRTAASGNAVILSEARGNLEQAEVVIDYRDMATAIIGGGAGEGQARYIYVLQNPSWLPASPFARIERFLDDSNAPGLGALQKSVKSALRAGREITTFAGNLIETPALTRGIHFDLGDLLTAEHPRTAQQFDCSLDVVHETIDAAGGRRSQIVLRATA